MRNKKKFLTGFTLIELLVVIAIIGILASIVLVSFPGAQKKANDSRVISAIAQARTVMTYYEANAGTLVGFSCTSEDMPNLCAEVVKNSLGGVALSITIVGTGSSAAACMSAPLRATSGQHYCADSTGKAGRTTGTGGVICNATTAVCNGTLID
ncbi:prepilin-type N-terminal cleavage/methylation domain-containing protein [Candidatus Gribaldobacteria bacterium]|nr:prepilin-type N-terminal cleavage/methylation domain-containing protein [Candidatus Gribaldobacteria bacterium]